MTRAVCSPTCGLDTGHDGEHWPEGAAGEDNPSDWEMERRAAYAAVPAITPPTDEQMQTAREVYAEMGGRSFIVQQIDIVAQALAEQAAEIHARYEKVADRLADDAANYFEAAEKYEEGSVQRVRMAAKSFGISVAVRGIRLVTR